MSAWTRFGHPLLQAELNPSNAQAVLFEVVGFRVRCRTTPVTPSNGGNPAMASRGRDPSKTLQALVDLFPCAHARIPLRRRKMPKLTAFGGLLPAYAGFTRPRLLSATLPP